MNKVICFILCLCLLCCACDGRRIQDMLFIYALGVDYKDGQYEVNGQIMNYATIAGGDKSGTPQETDNLWIGKSKDPILENALYKLRSSSDTMSFGHLNTFIFGPGILKDKKKVVTDQIFRSRSTRLTPWLFATNESLDKVLSVSQFLTKTPYYSIYNQPKEVYKQDSFIPPIRIHRFSSQINEPDNLAIIPTLAITKKTWRNEKKDIPQLYVSGAYTLQKSKPTHSFSLDQLKGLRWVSEQTVDTPIYLSKNKKEFLTLTARKPKLNIQTTFEKTGKTNHIIDIDLKAELVQTDVTVPAEKIERMLEKKIRDEVISTYEYGKKRDVDIFRLRFHTYQKDTKMWKQIMKTPLAQDILIVRVHAEVINTGYLKNDTFSE